MTAFSKTLNVDQLNLLLEELIQEEPQLQNKVVKALGLSFEETHEGILEMLKFLVLVSISPQVLTPSKVVDKIWHEFILFTRTYDKFCKQHFGRFIHHQPDGGKVANGRQFRRLIALYELKFGSMPAKFWGEGISNSECGGCSSQ